ncbi:hypothetical protein ACFL67_04435, partial [candidate division KSB1 bacterium]
DSVMDFKFVEQENVILVISCKSFVRSGNIDSKYCDQMKPFIKRIWLFAECCGPKSASSIQLKAKSYGYNNFWHLYTWNKRIDQYKENEEGWIDFIQEIKKLKP